MNHHVWHHTSEEIPYNENTTNYHYEYAFVDHRHYVNVNYPRGMGTHGNLAAFLTYQPFNKSIADLPIEQSYSFIWDTPSGATVEEHFHYDYTYTYNDHEHYVSGIDAYGLKW